MRLSQNRPETVSKPSLESAIWTALERADQKDQPGLTKRVVSVRKYRQCAADYLKLAKEPNTMREVAERYLRIAAYYLELADTEDTDEGDAKLVDAAPQLVSQERDG